ncbi:hypothetical protein POTOM_010734 [Populus tomentosa]|uniref:Uncharacterized protein n=1 Tax=Populus tomentosa TaxID=118781 RepID=A0A8X8DCP0_POPTO|nr:hypothetical protein POTOM_010734 [Populus tomentosa]
MKRKQLAKEKHGGSRRPSGPEKTCWPGRDSSVVAGWLTRSLSRDISSGLVSRFCNIILFHVASKWGHYLSCKPVMPPLRYDEAPNQTYYDMKRKNLRDDMAFKSNTPRSDLDLRRLRKLKDPD